MIDLATGNEQLTHEEIESIVQALDNEVLEWSNTLRRDLGEFYLDKGDDNTLKYLVLLLGLSLSDRARYHAIRSERTLLDVLRRTVGNRVNELINDLQNSLISRLNSIFLNGINHAIQETNQINVLNGSNTTLSNEPYMTSGFLAESRRLNDFRWSGQNLSEKFSIYKTELNANIMKTIIQDSVLGKDFLFVVFDIERELNKFINRLNTLIRTESNYIYNQGKIYEYKRNKIEFYKYVAVVDDRTTAICLSLNGNIFKVDECVVGINCPPMHPNCRSTIIPFKE